MQLALQILKILDLVALVLLPLGIAIKMFNDGRKIKVFTAVGIILLVGLTLVSCLVAYEVTHLGLYTNEALCVDWLGDIAVAALSGLLLLAILTAVVWLLETIASLADYDF